MMLKLSLRLRRLPQFIQVVRMRAGYSSAEGPKLLEKRYGKWEIEGMARCF